MSIPIHTCILNSQMQATLIRKNQNMGHPDHKLVRVEKAQTTDKVETVSVGKWCANYALPERIKRANQKIEIVEKRGL